MAVIVLPIRMPVSTGNWLGRLCLCYVNWCARNSRHRSLAMRLSLEALTDVAPDPATCGLTFEEMDQSGGLRSLLRIYNQAYVGAPDYRRAGRVHALAIQTSKGFDPSLVWIARWEGRPVGFCMARLSDGSGRITGLGVLPSVRRHGIGTMLMRHALRELRTRGAETVSLSVCDTNIASIRVYRHLGFREV